MANFVEFFSWWIVDDRTGERRLTTYKLSRAAAISSGCALFKQLTADPDIADAPSVVLRVRVRAGRNGTEQTVHLRQVSLAHRLAARHE